MSGQWQPSAIHHHSCAICGEEMVCVCLSRGRTDLVCLKCDSRAKEDYERQNASRS